MVKSKEGRGGNKEKLPRARKTEPMPETEPIGSHSADAGRQSLGRGEGDSKDDPRFSCCRCRG